MRIRKIYTITKLVLCIFIIGLSAFVDVVLISRHSLLVLLGFIIAEAVLFLYSFLLFRYVNKTVLRVTLKGSAVTVETLGGTYRTALGKIQVIKGRLNYYIMKFQGKSLRVYRSNKDVNAFIKKYFVRIKTS